MILLNNPSFRLLQGSLDASALRQNVIANNIANEDTPYFKRSDVKFEDLLKNQINGSRTIEGKRTDPRHFVIGSSSSVRPQVVTDEKSVMNNNQNNVDIDSEMSLLAKNQLRYNTMIQQLNNQLKQASIAIDGRR